MKDKASWILVIVALIGAISANVQTLTSTASTKADQANNNVKVVVQSIQEQLRYTDKQSAIMLEKISQLSESIKNQDVEIHELRTMMFALTSRRSSKTPVEESATDDVSSDVAKVKKSISKSPTAVIAKKVSRPAWPPAQLSFD